MEVCREGIRKGLGLISTVGEQGLVCVLLLCVCVCVCVCVCCFSCICFLLLLLLFLFSSLFFGFLFEGRGGGFWVVVVFFPHLFLIYLFFSFQK